MAAAPSEEANVRQGEARPQDEQDENSDQQNTMGADLSLATQQEENSNDRTENNMECAVDGEDEAAAAPELSSEEIAGARFELPSQSGV